jgi:hypothetical protein
MSEQESIKDEENLDVPEPPGPENPGPTVTMLAEWLEEFEKQEGRKASMEETVLCLAHIIDMSAYAEAVDQIEQNRALQQKLKDMNLPLPGASGDGYAG